jgi:formylglycine-generating enzyme required for sulfatase activity
MASENPLCARLCAEYIKYGFWHTPQSETQVLSGGVNMVSNLILRSTAFVLLAVFAVFAGAACKGKGSTSIESITVTLPGSDVQLTMNRIPAGTFTMDCPTTEPDRESCGTEETRLSVTLTRGFYMGKYAVTQEQYSTVMGINPSEFTSGTPLTTGETDAFKRPVEMVNWYHAIAFCNRLSILAGLEPAYTIAGISNANPDAWLHSAVPTVNNAAWNAVTANWDANGYRLPTEAEWEYACRAGTTTAFHCGKSDDDTQQKTHQVGLKTSNAYGLYDMHGNVLEWVWNWYADYAGGDDPTGPDSGLFRVVRSRCWLVTAENLRAIIAEYLRAVSPENLRAVPPSLSIPPSHRGNILGFRVVRTAQ